MKRSALILRPNKTNYLFVDEGVKRRPQPTLGLSPRCENFVALLSGYGFSEFCVVEEVIVGPVIQRGPTKGLLALLTSH